jgi:hypothetical protein
MSKTDSKECKELKTIKYKTMLLSGNPDINPNIKDNLSKVDMILERESNLNKAEPWSKLDKTVKLNKLNEYVSFLTKEHKLTNTEIKTIKKELHNALDKKQLQRVKDVNYDKDTGHIKNIPNLHFNKNTRKFTMKRSEKLISTLKSLGPKKNQSSTKRTNKDKIDSI